MEYNDLTSDQIRTATNLENTYYVFREAERFLLGGNLRWKTVNEQVYLYKYPNGKSLEISLGVRNKDTEALMEQFKNYEEQVKYGGKKLMLLGKMYKAARLPTIANFAGNVLRALDRHGFLDQDIRVIGTHALAAYELEAQCLLSDEGIKMTEDLDLNWQSSNEVEIEPPKNLYRAIKESDSTWTVSSENTFRITNKYAEEVELLIPEVLLKYAPKGPWRAISIEWLEYLMGGRSVEHVVSDLKGNPARIVAPDPRLFAIHKWMVSKSETRRVDKRRKDRTQSLTLLNLIEEKMPHYEFDDDFQGSLAPPMKEALIEMRLSPFNPANKSKVTTKQASKGKLSY